MGVGDWPKIPRNGIDQPIEGAADPSMTVLRLVQEMRRVKLADSEWYKEAEIRERIVLGEQIPDYDPSVVQNATPVYDMRAPMHENVLFPALQTLVARIDQGRIDAKAWAHTPTASRLAAAEAANLLLDAERGREKRDMKVHEALFWALVHGESGIYTTWDEAHGPHEGIEPVLDADGMPAIDPATGMPLQQLVETYGALRVEVLSTFAFWTSGEDTADDVRWQVRRRIVDKWTAMAALRAAGIDRKVEDRSFATKGRNRRRQGVEVLEVWVKPGAMIGPGLFALVVDDCVCKATTYPYAHKRLPITVLSCMRVEDSPHGHTVTKDAISQQRLVNVALRAILRRADVASDARVVGESEIIDGYTAEREGRIKYSGKKKASDAAAWLVGPEAPQTLLTTYQMAKAALQDVVGVSAESTTGGDPTSTTSGEQLKTAAALDSQKTVPLRRRAEEAWCEVDRQKIELFREKATLPRLASVAGDPVRAMYLQGADLDGVDVAIESASGLAMSKAGQARTAEERTAAGLLDPVAGAQMSATGQPETVMDNEARQRIERQGAEALRGVPQQPLPDVPADAAVRHLRLMLQRAPAGRTAMLLQLIAMYEQHSMMGGGAMPAAPMPGAPAGGRPKATPSSATSAAPPSPEVIQ